RHDHQHDGGGQRNLREPSAGHPRSVAPRAWRCQRKCPKPARITNATTGTQSPSRWYGVTIDPIGTLTTVTPRNPDGHQARRRPRASKAELSPDNPTCTAGRPASTARTAGWAASCGWAQLPWNDDVEL